MVSRLGIAAVSLLVAAPGLAQIPEPDAYCASIKPALSQDERQKCIVTRSLIKKLRAGDQSAQWSDQVDLNYTLPDAQFKSGETPETNLLFEFMLRSIPAPAGN
jgi:hypothetical protein